MRRLTKEIRVYRDPDDDRKFIEWCEAHPNGFVFNCEIRDGEPQPYMLHAALPKLNELAQARLGRVNDLCYSFRNEGNPSGSGYRDNLTTGPNPKVVSRCLEALEKRYGCQPMCPYCQRWGWSR